MHHHIQQINTDIIIIITIIIIVTTLIVKESLGPMPECIITYNNKVLYSVEDLIPRGRLFQTLSAA